MADVPPEASAGPTGSRGRVRIGGRPSVGRHDADARIYGRRRAFLHAGRHRRSTAGARRPTRGRVGRNPQFGHRNEAYRRAESESAPTRDGGRAMSDVPVTPPDGPGPPGAPAPERIPGPGTVVKLAVGVGAAAGRGGGRHRPGPGPPPPTSAPHDSDASVTASAATSSTTTTVPAGHHGFGGGGRFRGGFGPAAGFGGFGSGRGPGALRPVHHQGPQRLRDPVGAHRHRVRRHRHSGQHVVAHREERGRDLGDLHRRLGHERQRRRDGDRERQDR